MRVRLAVRGWEAFLSVGRRHKTKGINSVLPDGRHMLMWDFDDVPFRKVHNELTRLRTQYGLANIHVIQSSAEGCYHAYCFQSRKWADVLRILADTHYLDQAFFKIGIMRGYFTLRIRNKRGFHFTPIEVIGGPGIEDVNIDQLTTLEYWTKKG